MWLFVSRTFVQIITPVRLIVLARLLSPRDFGLFGVVLLSLAVLEIVSNPEMRLALIQRTHPSEKHLNTAWVVNVIRGIVLSVILFFSSSLIADFFNEPRAKELLQFLSAFFILDGFKNIGIIYLKKELNFSRSEIYETAGVLTEVVVTIVAAFLLKSAWALVLGKVAGSLVLFVSSYIIHPFRPKLEAGYRELKDLFSFGLWIQGGNVLSFITNYGDDTFVGRILGAKFLGFYQMAFQVVSFTEKMFLKTISPVIFPALSKLKDNLSKFRKGFLRIFELRSAFMLPATMGLALLTPQIVSVVLGEKWMAIVPVLRILCFSKLVSSISMDSHFEAIGKPSLGLYKNSIKIVVMLAFLYPLTVHFGIAGTAVAVLLGWVVSTPFWFYYSLRILKVKLGALLTKLLPSTVGTIIMILGLFPLKHLMAEIEWLQLSFLIVFGAILYLAVELFFWRVWKKGPVGYLIMIKNNI